MTEHALAVRDDPHVSMGMLRAEDAQGLVASASAMAKALADVIDRQKLFSVIQGRKYVQVEGWTTLTAMLGIVPQEESNIPQDDGSFVATVRLVKVSDGSVVGRASSECGDPTDGPWGRRARYARRSMAATRATGKACRLSFSWIMKLAGFEATPAEEMPRDEPSQKAIAKPEKGETGTWEGRIVEVSEKRGTTATGKPWTLYLLAGEDGVSFTTFDEKIKSAGEFAVDGDAIEIGWEEKKGQRAIVTLDLLDVDEPTEAGK